MQIMIDIPDEIYKKYMDDRVRVTDVLHAVRHGTPLPKGHGRLIDADELKRTMEKDKRRALSFVDLTDFVWLAPTIIEADKGE